MSGTSSPPTSATHGGYGFHFSWQHGRGPSGRATGLGQLQARLRDVQDRIQAEESSGATGMAHSLRLKFWEGDAKALAHATSANQELHQRRGQGKPWMHLSWGSRNMDLAMHPSGTASSAGGGGGGGRASGSTRETMAAFNLHGRMSARNQARYFPDGATGGREPWFDTTGEPSYTDLLVARRSM